MPRANWAHHIGDYPDVVLQIGIHAHQHVSFRREQSSEQSILMASIQGQLDSRHMMVVARQFFRSAPKCRRYCHHRRRRLGLRA